MSLRRNEATKYSIYNKLGSPMLIPVTTLKQEESFDLNSLLGIEFGIK